MYPNVPITALTATANEEIIQEIYLTMAHSKTILFKAPMNRSNLLFGVEQKTSYNTIVTNIIYASFQ